MNEAGFILIWLVAIAVWVYGLVDAARRPDSEYQAVGSSKVLWIVLIVVLGVIGSLIYLLAIRPKMTRSAPPTPTTPTT